jgi:hypothetical protein
VPFARVSDLSVPEALRGPVLVDGFGRPRYWACVNALLDFEGLRASTLDSRLSGVERLYSFLESQRPSVALDSLNARGVPRGCQTDR